MKRILKKLGKYLVVFLIGLIITINAFIILSGRFYLYKGVANTYLKGNSGPTIYDKDVFAYSTIDATGKNPWKTHKNYNTQKIPEDLREYIENLDTKAYLVFKNDTLLYEEYWDDHSEKAVSNSFSVAKTVVALLIGIAVEEGYIKSLDDPVADYLSEFKGDREVVTIRHLLTMSSGLDWTESGKNPLSDNAESYYGWDLRGQSTSQKLIDEPGKVFKYQSGNSQLLGYIVESATGQDLTKYAEEKIWKKIGAEDKAFWSLDKEGGDEKAFCCMYATARDYARIGQLLLNHGKFGDVQVIPEWYCVEMVRPASIMTEDGLINTRYGMHIWTFYGNTNPTYYCRGILGQYIIAIPKEDLLIIRLGSKRAPKFFIPDHLKNDKAYVEENKDRVGHPLGFFQYIALAKMIASQTED